MSSVKNSRKKLYTWFYIRTLFPRKFALADFFLNIILNIKMELIYIFTWKTLNCIVMFTVLVEVQIVCQHNSKATYINFALDHTTMKVNKNRL